MSALLKPFPLDGGRVGMGVIPSAAISAPAASSCTAVTPNPGPSPIKGEGRVL